MVISINAIGEPVGSVKSWLRSDNSVPLPSGWLICDGSTVVDATSPYNGKALPDFRGRFVRGHNTLDNSNFGADATYYAGGTIPNGGADSNSFNHSHAGPNHQHFMAIGSHVHGAGSYTAGGTTSLPSATVTVQGGAGSPSLPSGTHTHSFSSGVSGSSDGNSNSYYTAFEGTGTTSAALGSVDNRPSFRELIVIIKVR